MGISRFRSSIQSGLDRFSSQCESLIGGTKKRISQLLGGAFLATTLATTTGVAVADQGDTSKINTDSSSWSIAFNGPTTSKDVIENMKNITLDTLMAPLVLKTTESNIRNGNISPEVISLDRAPSYQSKLLEDRKVIGEIEKIPADIQKAIEKNANVYIQKYNLESKLSGFLHKDYKQEAPQIELQDVAIDIHTVRSSEGNKSKNQELARTVSQDAKKLIEDGFGKNLPSVGLQTDISSEVYALTDIEKDFLHQVSKKYSLSEYHLIQGYNSGRLPLDADEKRKMKLIFDDHRYLSVSGNVQYTRTDTHNTPLPIGALGLLVGGILGTKKLLKTKNTIKEGIQKGIGKIQGFLRNGFRAVSGIFSSKETVADRMKKDKKRNNAMIAEHKRNFPNEKFDSGDVGSNFEKDTSPITSEPVLEDITYDPSLSSAEIAIQRSRVLMTKREVPGVGGVPTPENQPPVNTSETNNTSIPDGEKIDPVSEGSLGEKEILITTKIPGTPLGSLDESPKDEPFMNESGDAQNTTEVSPGIPDRRIKYPNLRLCIDRLDFIKDAMFHGMSMEDELRMKKYRQLYRQLLIEQQWLESRIFLGNIIAEFGLSEAHPLVVFKKEMVDTYEVQSDLLSGLSGASDKKKYNKRICMLRSGRILTQGDLVYIKIGNIRGQAEIMHISDDINIMFRSEHDNTEKKYIFSRKELELYLENSTLDPILLDRTFQQYVNGKQFSAISHGMYTDKKFTPKKRIVGDDGRIFYVGERISMYGTRGISECCAIYTVVNNHVEAWVFTKSEDGKWKSMPHISDTGPQICFSDKKGKSIPLRDDLSKLIEGVGLSADSSSWMDIIRPLYPIEKVTSSSSPVNIHPSSFSRKVAY